MRMLDTWHRRWLREELGRARDEEGHVTPAQVMTLDSWSGWVTAAAVDQRRLSAGVGRRCTAGSALAHGHSGVIPTAGTDSTDDGFTIVARSNHQLVS
jgi:hypothetical protein